MFWDGGHWVFWQVALMWVAMLVFWGLVVWAIWALVTSVARRPPSGPGGGEDATTILNRRLARGEIDAEEYRRLRRVLTGEAPLSTGAGPAAGTGGSHT